MSCVRLSLVPLTVGTCIVVRQNGLNDALIFFLFDKTYMLPVRYWRIINWQLAGKYATFEDMHNACHAFLELLERIHKFEGPTQGAIEVGTMLKASSFGVCGKRALDCEEKVSREDPEYF